MNLTDLQVELHAIEDRISSLQNEIEKMKPRSEDEKIAALEQITKAAAQYPLECSDMKEQAEDTKKDYIVCLTHITLADESNIHEKLLYICRLAKGMGLQMSAETILRMGMEVDKIYFDRACLELKQWKYSLLTDALILANITKEATDATFSLIADLSKIMECDKEELRVIAHVAKAVLTNDFNVLSQIPSLTKNRWMGQFQHHIPASWIKSKRELCGKYFTGVMPSGAMGGQKVKHRLPAESLVKKGDVLVAYEGESPEEIFSDKTAFLWLRSSEQQNLPAEKTILAPCDGIVFFIEGKTLLSATQITMECVYAYVVSYFDDYKDFCQWHKKKHG